MAPEKLEQLRELAHELATACGSSMEGNGTTIISTALEEQFVAILSRHDFAAESRASRAEMELSRFLALEKHLPKGYAIGDDATAELAVELARAEQATKEAEESLKAEREDHHETSELWAACTADSEIRLQRAELAESRLSVERERVTELETVLLKICEQTRDAVVYDLAARALSVKPEETTPPSEGHTS